MTEQYSSSSEQDSGYNLRSNGIGTKLPYFAERHGLGLPQPHYHGECQGAGYCIPERRMAVERSNDEADVRCLLREPSEKWSLYLRFLVFERGGGNIVIGWGKSLDGAYENYIGRIKLLYVIVRSSRRVLVPGDLIP